MNLKKKLALALVVASALPLILFTAVSLSNSMDAAKTNAMAENLKRAELVQEKIHNLLDKNMHGVKALAANPLVRSYPTQDANQIKALVVDTKKVYTDLDPMIVTAFSGTQVARSDKLPITSVADRRFFNLAIKGQPEVVSEVLVSKDNGHLISVLAAPVTDINTGSIIGVAQGNIELAVLNEFVRGLSQDDVVVYIVDTEGKLLAHPTKNLEKPEERVDLTQYDFVKQGLAGGSGSGEVTIDGERMLVSYIRNDQSGWLVCTEIPYRAAVAQSIKDALFSSFIGLVLILITGGIAFVLANIATKPIMTLVNAANSIAEGNLTIEKIEIKSKDELGLLAQSFNSMVVNLSQLIRKMKENAELVAASSEQLNASSEQSAQAANQVASSITEVAQGAEKQRLVVEKTTAIVDQMSENIGVVAANANVVSEQSMQTAETAKEGGAAIHNAVQHMTDLEITVNESALVVTKLGERSKEIGQIVNTISGIAGQTNLLALNAAIEAARAGEQGRGFAVVAEEVRKLAEQSQVAAKQIEELIGDIQNETDRAVQAMDDGTSKVKTGTNVVNEAGVAFRKIVDMIATLSEQVKGITAAIQNADSGSRQIVSAVQDIAAVTSTVTGEAQTVSAATEEQSASMQEIASSSQSLAKMALELQEAIRKFRT